MVELFLKPYYWGEYIERINLFQKGIIDFCSVNFSSADFYRL